MAFKDKNKDISWLQEVKIKLPKMPLKEPKAEKLSIALKPPVQRKFKSIFPKIKIKI
jgi:hypothetical protein